MDKREKAKALDAKAKKKSASSAANKEEKKKDKVREDERGSDETAVGSIDVIGPSFPTPTATAGSEFWVCFRGAEALLIYCCFSRLILYSTVALSVAVERKEAAQRKWRED